MSKNLLNVNYYSRLLESYILENQSLILESGYPYGPFIPYTFPRYPEAPIKIFYVGRDTYYWIERSELIDDKGEVYIENYFSKNKAAVTRDVTLKWGNMSGAFWSFVDKLHLYIRTGIVKDLTNLNDDDLNILDEIAYGNMNCMELDKTLINNEGREESDFDREKLNQLRCNSRCFDRIEHILNAYPCPDFIVILNWEDREDYFEKVDYTFEEDLFIENIQSVLSLKDYKTKIIWGPHPNRFKFLGENSESMVRRFGDLILSLNK